MKSHRESILEAVRRSRPAETALPRLDPFWIRYDDIGAQFTLSLESVGGAAVRVENLRQAAEYLAELPHYGRAQRRLSLVEGIPSSNVEWDAITDPHQLENIEFAVLPARFGVAENGAVWVTAEKLKHRAILFICQHLALVMPADRIVATMHEAYQRLDSPESPDALRRDQPDFGVFISGPSKTADIEQSLVIGAHGPRSLTVLVVGSVDSA